MLNRRALLGAMAGTAVASSMSNIAWAGESHQPNPVRGRLDFGAPKDSLYALLKFMGDLSGKRTYYYQPGRIFAFREGELPTHILSYFGVTSRELLQLSDTRYMSRHGGWMLMMDPVTHEVIDEWKNPWSGKKKKVTHFVSPVGKQIFDATTGLIRPKSFRGSYNWSDREFVLPWKFVGDQAWAPYEKFTIYTDMEGNHRYENAIHTYNGRLSDLLNPNLTSAPSTIASQSQSPYFSWMGPEGLKGHMILTSLGTKLEKLEDLPESVRNDIELRYPGAIESKFDWSEAKKLKKS